MNSDIVSLIIILICVMLSAYFSATETSFTSLNRIRMKNMAEKGDKRAELVLKLLENFDKLLSTILVGNNIVNIGLSSIATVLFIKLLGGDSGATVSTIVTTIVVLIFGEVSPKSIAKESPETIAKFSAPFLHILMIVLTPVTFFFSQWKKLLSRIFKSSENHGITDEELMTIVEEATQEGDIDDQEGDLIQNAIGFMEMEAAEIFTPRVNVIGIPLDATKSEIAKTFSDTGFSRLPVYDDDIDHIVGIVYQKDFHNHIYHTNKPLSSIIRPALFVTENTKVGPLLKKCRRRNRILPLSLMNSAAPTVSSPWKISSKSSSAKSGMSMMRLYRKSRKFPKTNTSWPERQASTRCMKSSILTKNLTSLRSADGSWGSSSACQRKAIISSRMAST